MRRAVLLLCACGHAATPREPQLTADPPWVAPEVQEFRVHDMRVLLVEDHRLPVVALATVHRGAGSRADGERPGVAALVADLLPAGSGKRDARAFGDAIAREGARFEVDAATDYTTARVVVLSDHVPAALALLADAIERPRFDEAELARVKEARLAELARDRERPRAIAARAFDKLAFGETHPYAHPALGTQASVAAITTADLRALWMNAYRPETTTIVAAGDIARDQLARELATAFGTWMAPEPAAPWLVPAAELQPAPRSPAIALVDVPGAEQTTILIGGVVPNHDRVAADLENGLLGGDSAARLERELREHLAVTFAASSSFWRGEWAQTWAIATTVRADATVPALRAALALVTEARTHDAPAAELAATRTRIARATAQSFETITGTERALERLVIAQLPADFYATLPDRLAHTTAADARAAIADVWRDPSIVLVGDASRIGDLSALGLPIVHLAP